MTSSKGQAFRSFSVRGYRRFFFAQTGSAIGTWMQVIAQSWLVYKLTGSGAALGLAVMLLDVLSGLDEIKVCTAYTIDGKSTTRFPSHVDDIRAAKPVYESLPGWKEEITGCRSYADPIERAVELE